MAVFSSIRDETNELPQHPQCAHPWKRVLCLAAGVMDGPIITALLGGFRKMIYKRKNRYHFVYDLWVWIFNPEFLYH